MEKNENGYSVLGAENAEPNGHPSQLAMVYALPQEFRSLYDPAEALNRGTLFYELDKPLSEVTGK
ncbi:MAG: spore coat associated protein CotJA [Clostridia bacterium]|nr:spore coat associated protein CotJA [Clostridia bacterium]